MFEYDANCLYPLDKPKPKNKKNPAIDPASRRYAYFLRPWHELILCWSLMLFHMCLSAAMLCFVRTFLDPVKTPEDERLEHNHDGWVWSFDHFSFVPTGDP